MTIGAITTAPSANVVHSGYSRTRSGSASSSPVTTTTASTTGQRDSWRPGRARASKSANFVLAVSGVEQRLRSGTTTRALVRSTHPGSMLDRFTGRFNGTLVPRVLRKGCPSADPVRRPALSSHPVSALSRPVPPGAAMHSRKGTGLPARNPPWHALRHPLRRAIRRRGYASPGL